MLKAYKIKLVQQIVGNLLNYTRAVESPILLALNEIADRQALPTENIWNRSKMLLDFCASHPNVPIRFSASDMVLHIDTY